MALTEVYKIVWKVIYFQDPNTVNLHKTDVYDC